MTAVNKIDSNITGLRYTKESQIGVFPGGTPIWTPLEPNSYNDFGGQITTVARNPINAARQRKKGVITDLDASGGFNMDLTQTNSQDLLQGFFFAALRKKGDLAVTAASGTAYTVASGGAVFVANSLAFGSGFGVAGNNGVHLVSAATGTSITAAGLTAEASPPAGAQIVRVGIQGASGDIGLTNSGGVVTLTSTALDFTTLGLIPGEWMFIGGDLTAEQFATAVDNGFARIKSIAAHAIILDKTQKTTVTDAGAAKTIRLYFGRVLRNESGANIVRSTYQLERQLGAPDDSSTNQQAEYIVGAVPNELTINIKQADKVTVDMSFVATGNELAAAGSLKAGNRPALAGADAFNTSSDFTRIKMGIYNAGDANPTPLFAFITDATITINNNVSPNKAVGTLGAFDVTAGTFEVGGKITAYFSTVAAVQSVRNNANATLDMHLVKTNAGISIDIPLIGLGDGRPAVEQDSPITLPLDMAAASGEYLNALQDHSLLMVFYDYLPTLADA